MYSTPGCEIPGVGKADFAWVSTPLPPVNLDASNGAPKKAGEDTTMGEGDGDAMAGSYGAARAPADGTADREELDYDVGEEWDNS